MSTKERPILFSAPMVRAILEGKKTQTRRVFKFQPHPDAELRFVIPRPNARGSCAFFAHVDNKGIHSHGLTLWCPYGMPGDRLWVRETWAVQHEYDAAAPSEIGSSARWHYAATEDLGGLRKRPSIFLPRRGSRITLEITDVWVERLQQISEADARAEGAIGALDSSVGNNWCARQAFAALWQSLNGSDSWHASPWVWVVEFRKLETAQQEVAA